MSSGALTQRAIGSLLILPVAAVALFPPAGTLAVTVLFIALAAREAAKILTKVIGGASAFWITIILVSPLFAAVSPALGAVLTITTLLLFVGTVIRRAVRASEKRLEPELRLLLGTMAAVIWLSPLTLLPLLASLDPLDRDPRVLGGGHAGWPRVFQGVPWVDYAGEGVEPRHRPT